MSDTHDKQADGTGGPDGPAADWRHWHERREAAVASSYGPLSLTGTHWLADFPDGRLPELPGEWREDGDEVVLTAEAADGLTVDGKPFAGTVRLTADPAFADFRAYVAGFEPRMLAVAVELVRKWGKRAATRVSDAAG